MLKNGKKDMDDDYKKGYKTDDFSSVLLLSDNAMPATSTSTTTKNPRHVNNAQY